MEYSFAAAMAGGIALGVGIGMVLRYGGFIDAADGAGMGVTPGTSAKTRKSLWLFNGAVLLAGGFVFGWDEALYSIVAFLLAFRMADFSMSGFALTRMVWITSERSEAISDAMRSRFGKELILLDDQKPCPGGTRMMLCTVNRIEQARVIREIRALDPECSIALHAVHR